ncbi:MAG: 4Fe-4S binding protein [Methanomicrobiales archaeon]|nr:4Fe-4S binding protein [Methanomicrobiales archaeon]MDD1660061.1 4Fe-4S binding protein [Methanomicrobiales archaeon]
MRYTISSDSNHISKPVRIDRTACVKCYRKLIIDPRKELVSIADVVIPQSDGTLLISQGPVCLTACPSEAISIVDDEVVVDDGACVDCESCVDECPAGALELI